MQHPATTCTWLLLAAVLLCLSATSVSEVERPVPRIAFFKTHKTGSSTFGSILARAAAVHQLSVYPPFGHYITPGQVHKGFKEGSSNIVLQHVWQYNSKAQARFQDWFSSLVVGFYTRALGADFELFTTFREPVSLWLSYFHYFIQPGNNATMEMGLERKLGVNRLARDFDLRSVKEMVAFIKSDTFKRIIFIPTDKFDVALAYLCVKYGWRKSDVLYTSTNVNQGMRPRWKGDKHVAQRPPSISELSPDTVLQLQEINYLDMLLYGAALAQYVRWEARVLQDYPEMVTWLEEFKCLRSNIPACSDESPSGLCTWLGMEDLVYEAMFFNLQGLANVNATIPDSEVLITDAIREAHNFEQTAVNCRAVS